MTIYTGIADDNGNFTIDISSPLTSGEIVQVTAQKDGQSKSINVQAPSEPYLPIIVQNTDLMFPINHALSSVVLSSGALIYDKHGGVLTVEGNVNTLSNTYFQADQDIRMIQIFKMNLSDYKNAADTDVLFGFALGFSYDDGSFSFSEGSMNFTKRDVTLSDSDIIQFLMDDSYLYMLLINAMKYNSSSGFDEFADKYAFKITYKGNDHIFKIHKNYSQQV